MKKNFVFLILLLSFIHPLKAQYTPFFNDEFDSNTNNWFVGEIKKSTVQFYNGSYCVYNDWGKSPIISLMDLPFDEKKNYRIKSTMTEGYIPPYADGKYGVMFAAKDEKNGYAVLLDQVAVCYVVKIENGKVKELNRNSNSGGNTKGGEISIILEDWRWQFKVDGKEMYSCDPLPWMGHKAGLYCSAESGYSAANLTIEEAAPGPSPCPLPFTQEQLNETLSKLICAAADDFAAVQGAADSKTDNMEVWKTKDVSLTGSKDIFLARNIPPNKKGKDFIIMFACSDIKNPDFAEIFFDQFMKAISEVKPPCGTLKQREVEKNLADFLLKSVIWDVEIKTASSGTVHVIVELDFNKFKTDYYNTVHVNVPM